MVKLKRAKKVVKWKVDNQNPLTSENQNDEEKVVKCKVEYINSALNITITNDSEDTIITGYGEFRLYKKQGEEWGEGISEGLTYIVEEVAIILEKGKSIQYSIPFYLTTENDKLVTVENPLKPGEYKYIHYYNVEGGEKKSTECLFEVK